VDLVVAVGPSAIEAALVDKAGVGASIFIPLGACLVMIPPVAILRWTVFI